MSSDPRSSEQPTAAPAVAPDAVRSTTGHDPTADLVRLGLVHGAAIFLPVAVVGVLVLPPLLGLLVALVVAVVVTVVRSRGIDERVGRALGARPVAAADHPRYAGLVESVAMGVGVAPPVLHVIDDPGLNALSWGSGTGAASIAVTTGLLDAAERIELEAVVAHVLVDVRDGIVEGPTVATALFGPLAGGPLAGIVATLARTAADDRRVVLADLEGVRATQYPPGAVLALERLRDGDTRVARCPRPLHPLWIDAPAPLGDADPFAVHPPLADRIDLLREL